MLNKENVLIFPAGSENAIEVYDSLKYNVHFNVFGASAKSDHAEFIYPKDRLFIGDLYISNDNFIHNFNHVLERFNISYIIPTHDTIAVYLKKNEDKIKAKVVCSPYETARIAENKFLTYKFLKDAEYFPKVYEDYNDVDKFPVFIKPYRGAGGKGTYIAESKKILEEIVHNNDSLLICEYLPGEEYTVDCFTDKNGKLMFCGPRKRARINMGISFRSERIINSKPFLHIAEDLNSKFRFRGSWFFQVKEDEKKELKLMEFSVRQAGTMAFFRQLGVNFAALSLFDAMGYDVTVLFNDYDLILDRCLKSKYRFNYNYKTLYIDFDDTLIVNNKVNTTLIKLIYQSINQKKKVVLLTKHQCDLDESLRKYRINKDLFDDIIVLDPSIPKYHYIIDSNSIFIDNYFPERLSVRENCNIPVFDVDAIECLLDYTDI